MENSQNLSSHVKSVVFYDYKPAEIKIAKRWFIVFYAKNPLLNKLVRFRVSVPVIENKTERIKHAKKMVLEINRKLESGWLPFIAEDATQEFKTFEYCTNKLLDYLKEDIRKGNKRPDTLRSYTSFVSMINKYCVEKNQKIKLVLEFNKIFVIKYLDWIMYERDNSEVTYNNHLAFLITFLNFCIARGWIKDNFCLTIPKKTEKEKIRQIFTAEIKKKIRQIENVDSGYYTLCMATYFCFIRRTELTKIKVKDISIQNQTITIQNNNSKNKKTEIVTIPNMYLPLLIEHVKKATNEQYLFSDNFQTGEKQLTPKKISDTWEKFRKKLGIESMYQFYSLKDTGITDLLNSGIPAIKVRNQARHSDIKITEKYTSWNKKSDEIVKNSTFNF